MSKDSQPAIYLEVIIPRIVSPISQPTSPDQHPDATGLQADMPANEAIGLTTLGSGEPPRSLQPAQETIEQASTNHTKHGMHFRLFRLTALPLSQTLLLRIFHRARNVFQHRNTSEQYLISETFPLHLAIMPATSSAPAPQPRPGTLMTQATQVEIVLDEEGVPTSYRIDGAEG